MRRIAITYGLYFFAGLISIFLVSYAAGVAANYELRIINGLLHTVVLYYGIKQLRIDKPSTHQNYVSGVAQGFYIGAVGTILFMIFITLFLAFNASFLAELQAASGWRTLLTPIMGGTFVLMEGVAVSIIGAYVMTRYVDMRLELKAGAGKAYASRGDI
ncbi:MAG: hypothetical protein AAFY36_08445 [Bacteroidota bacterium]